MREGLRDVVELALDSWRVDVRKAAKEVLEALEEADLVLEEMETTMEVRTEVETMIEVARPVWVALAHLKEMSQSFELTARMLPEEKREEVRKEDLASGARRLVVALDKGGAEEINYARTVLEMVLQGISMEQIEPGVKAAKERTGVRRVVGEALEAGLSGPGTDAMG